MRNVSFTLGSFSSFRHPILPFFHSMLEKSWLYTTSIAFFVDPRMVLVSDLISTLNYAYKLDRVWLLVVGKSNR